MKKILIVYATAGEGHKRAAFAIKNALDCLSPPDTQIKIIDALHYTTNFFKRSYARTYLFVVLRMPAIWGFFYYCLDIRQLFPFVRIARRLVNKNNARALEDLLLEYNPDIVISTHFLTGEVISRLKKENRFKTMLITCVTDFRMHSFWFSRETDHFCVSFNETRQDLIKKWGVSVENIHVLGMPIHPKFYEQKEKKAVCDKLNISPDMFTVLITGGGFGVGPIEALVKALIKSGLQLQILIVCGHNAALRARLDKLTTNESEASRRGQRPTTRLNTFGFIDYIDELMSVSDVSITKAGGLISSEAVAKELPLIIISPIPGQESRNCRLLIKNGAAFRINEAQEAVKIIKDIFHDANLLKQMKENIRKIKKENPAAAIARFVVCEA
ncbi:MAG: glycosyltransferase [Candidatus Omnitrophica bacterium]|nr:glycosyltransferase [Candidatus Omnitrophota bacterium]